METRMAIQTPMASQMEMVWSPYSHGLLQAAMPCTQIQLSCLSS